MLENKNIIVLISLLILLIGAVSLFTCLCYFNNSDFNLPQIEDEYLISDYPFNEVWKNTLYLTGVDNSTAILDNMFIKCADDGAVELLKLYFYGQNQNQTQWYEIKSSNSENLTFSARNTDKIPDGVHPIILMEEIKKIPYDQLACKDKEITVDVYSESGDLEYDSAYVKVFLINEGKLTPLKRVVFHTKEPLYIISICCRADSNISGNRSDAVKNNICNFIFTENDFEKAAEYEKLKPLSL